MSDCVAAVNAAHQFYTATTTFPHNRQDDKFRKTKTEILNRCVDPEEKRMIIGDTFMRVSQVCSDKKYKINYSVKKYFCIFRRW